MFAKITKIFLILLAPLFLFTACKCDGGDPVPQITSYDCEDCKRGGLYKPGDSVNVKLTYEDGDGDLGSSDLNEYCGYVYSRDNNIIDSFKIINPSKNYQGCFKGEKELTIELPCCEKIQDVQAVCNPNTTLLSYNVDLSIELIDAMGNTSNRITLSTFELTCK